MAEVDAETASCQRVTTDQSKLYDVRSDSTAVG